MRKIVVLVLLSVFLVAGCSGSGTLVTLGSNESPQPIMGVTTNEDGSFSAIGLMGEYELSIDTTVLTADLVTKRLPSLGESWLETRTRASGIRTGIHNERSRSNCIYRGFAKVGDIIR